MTRPRNPGVPRFAPEGSITLATALDLFGRAFDPAWTGEEIGANAGPESSDEQLTARERATIPELKRTLKSEPKIRFYESFGTSEMSNLRPDGGGKALRKKSGLSFR